jgi:hypothetical protein
MPVKVPQLFFDVLRLAFSCTTPASHMRRKIKRILTYLFTLLQTRRAPLRRRTLRNWSVRLQQGYFIYPHFVLLKLFQSKENILSPCYRWYRGHAGEGVQYRAPNYQRLALSLYQLINLESKGWCVTVYVWE